MSAKNCDNHNRWQNITVGFRVSPEENEQLNRAVALSGLPKQEYCYRKCMDNSITVTPNPRILLWFYVPLAFTLLRCVSNLPLTTPFHFAGVTKSTH